MIIQNSNLAMSSYSQSKQRYGARDDVKFSVGIKQFNEAKDKDALAKENLKNALVPEKPIQVDFSDGGMVAVKAPKENEKSDTKKMSALALEMPEEEIQATQGIDIRDEYSKRLDMLQELINALFGDDYHLNRDIFGLYRKQDSGNSTHLLQGVMGKGGESFKATAVQYEYSHVEFEYSKMSTEFSTKGTVKTSDGKTINLNLNFKAQSENFKFSATKIEAAAVRFEKRFCDPLVINLDSESFGLSDISIDFDLDLDGVKDKINLPNKNMAFLALDKNENGKIDDGNELFGTKSGDGFKDLAKYDEDNNGWIDEADEIFDKLKLWVTTDDGQKLLSLRDAKVGAICLQSEDTKMVFKGEDYDKGILQKTGVFLREDGKAGTIHHIDLSI